MDYDIIVLLYVLTVYSSIITVALLFLLNAYRVDIQDRDERIDRLKKLKL